MRGFCRVMVALLRDSVTAGSLDEPRLPIPLQYAAYNLEEVTHGFLGEGALLRMVQDRDAFPQAFDPVRLRAARAVVAMERVRRKQERLKTEEIGDRSEPVYLTESPDGQCRAVGVQALRGTGVWLNHARFAPSPRKTRRDHSFPAPTVTLPPKGDIPSPVSPVDRPLSAGSAGTHDSGHTSPARSPSGSRPATPLQSPDDEDHPMASPPPSPLPDQTDECADDTVDLQDSDSSVTDDEDRPHLRRRSNPL